MVSHAHGRLLDKLLDDLRHEGALEHCRVIVTVNIDDAAFPIEKWLSTKIQWIRNAVPKGFAENHNAALAYAQTDWVLILNPDIRLRSGTLADMLSALPVTDDVGIVAPLIVSSSGRIEDSVRRNVSPVALLVRAFRHLLRLETRNLYSVEFPADWFAGMFLLMPRKVFSAVSGFDERYFLYCEDADLCFRVSLLGKRLILDERYQVEHNAQRSSRRSVLYFRWHISSLFKLWTSRSWCTFTFRRATGRLCGVERVRRVPASRAINPS